ncbi:hypothetical protein LGK95_01295 [Clostridium algoriphilum]|uniref:hypothetical protein n=1 Tax=Clostridium algoriphilum TaxID=198347 RepID=UPI001CF46333|nr:hypothetical protein [Clostridium algoriphilum]MCB2292171.1 hypothetical protein [Clostridium algoriphilum]
MSWQRDYRIKVVTQSSSDPFLLNIESLKDITIWGKVSDLINGSVDYRGGVMIPNCRT